jgi:flavin reductase (DIM6/NTAB) family NADH-FMN oxidoreductase RutF
MISSSPPFVMFSSADRKDSQRNAEETGEFVCSLASYELKDEMNASSAPFPPGVSEPERIGLEMAPSRNVRPPRVARAPSALECRYFKTVELHSADGKRNRSSVVIGEVVGIYIDDRVIVDGMLDIRRMRPVARLGYLDYSVVDDFFTMPRPAGSRE